MSFRYSSIVVKLTNNKYLSREKDETYAFRHFLMTDNNSNINNASKKACEYKDRTA